MNNSIITVNQWVFKKLSTDAKLKALVGKQIYPIVVEENGKFPFIVFTRRSVNVSYDNDGVSTESGQVVISVVAKNYKETIAIVQRVREILEPTIDDYCYRANITSMDEGFYNNCFVQTITFQITVKL